MYTNTLTHTLTHCRQYGAIPALIGQLRNEDTKVLVPVLGALRNLSFGRINDENKLMIVREQGLEELVLSLRMTRITEVGVWGVLEGVWRVWVCACVRACVRVLDAFVQGSSSQDIVCVFLCCLFRFERW